MGNHTNVKGISIFLWNMRSIMNKLDKFKAMIAESDHKVYCVTETWLKPNISDSFLHLDNDKT